MQITKLKIRPPKPSDLNFIQATFYKSMRRESTLGRQCSGRVFKQFQEVVDYILSISTIIVSCVEESEDAIIGYLIYQPEVVHYAYVRPSSQRLDVAKEMIKHAFPEAKTITFSLNTNSAKKISDSHPEMIFNPFVLYKRGIDHDRQD